MKRKLSKQNLMVGQYWQENDSRLFRVVQILEIKHYAVKITIVLRGKVRFYGNMRLGRTTWAAKSRFNNKNRGYSLLGGYCHECQLDRGARVPGDGIVGTVSVGTCSKCLKTSIGLVPSSDYDWPKEGKKAIWD